MENARKKLPKNCFSERRALLNSNNCRNSFCFDFCNIVRCKYTYIIPIQVCHDIFQWVRLSFFLGVGEVESYHRNNGGKRPPGRYDFARVTRLPGAFTSIPGRFLKKDFGAFGLSGRYVKTRKAHTHLSHAGRYKKTKKKVHTSHTHTATARQQQVLIMSQPSSTDQAPHKAQGDWT